MKWKNEWKALLWMLGGFLLIYNIPIESSRFQNAINEAFHLTQWYAQEHVLLCVIPAFFIAGAIAVFISQTAVMKYLGPKAKKSVAYGVSSVSGSVLAVCSCTVLPLFAGIYKMGAGIGPATAFLYSGPAVNVLAIILTAKILGPELGIARAIGAVLFSIIIGLLMHFIFRKDEMNKSQMMANIDEEEPKRSLLQNSIYFGFMIMILIFANWGKPEESNGFWFFVYNIKWIITAISSFGLATVLIMWFDLSWWKIALIVVPSAILGFMMPEQPQIAFTVAIIGFSIISGTDKGETGEWFESTWGFAKQIFPLLLFGILFAGALLGRPGHEGLIPSEWITYAVGGNSLSANFFSSIAGAFMYFATLTEIPILQGLMGNGMGKGPALALLLAGPALSLPSMLVIRSVMGNKKTAVYITLVVTMSTISGMIYGSLF